ncbi:hypothetical protein [Ferrovum myxofaciens]|uniref:Uncharacterized protein n=1 Tax=Ferrovum myxofaciens TaxID=416213 RepID=A0A9E6MY42_9PROT|nr:hypothetical protein [Ferrovum myxofaciens]MBU6994054.1 hypothetical protein [Ferrovum myxofaciens]QKE37997.1 MAG: hypothetical protein HO273_03995 [Ferrovum myxofaciens]QKE40590.1 MAG: hypothetical protein HO274_04130 [Ferrovum myxofaciens]QWY75697.1 MAG: hypothetical protein JVY19_04505 [Ferrovum myxofaciens]QWY78430.1 MAG: hypothetical protein JZL65_04985 [Ferrovum myxofaciens]
MAPSDVRLLTTHNNSGRTAWHRKFLSKAAWQGKARLGEAWRGKARVEQRTG